MKRLFLLFLTLATPALAQVGVAPNIAPIGAFYVLPGSVRNISAQMGVTAGTGPVTSVTLASGGSGYTAGDRFALLTIQQAGSSNTAKVAIAAINPSTGAITAISPTPLGWQAQWTGSSYSVGTGLATTGGHGTGATVNVTSLGQCTTAAGFACTGTWAVTGSGGATATFTNPSNTAVSSISGAIPQVQINVGSVGANCTTTGTAGNYTTTSTAFLTVTFTATDAPNPVASFTMYVCQNLTSATEANGDQAVVVIPAYQQVYEGQSAPLQSFVRRNVNQNGTWSIVSQPSGGNGALSSTIQDTACTTAGFPDCRDKLFSATVTGEYVIGYTSSVTGSTSTAIVYVAPQAMPSYVTTPNHTRPVPCFVDPSFSGSVFQVGPSHAFHTIESIPNIAGIQGGYMMQIFNEDTTGSNPTTYPEYFQVRFSGTPTNPVHICGVPDSAGNLPVISTVNATGQAGTAEYGFGSIILFGSSHFSPWQNGSAGPSYVEITGINFEMPGGYSVNSFNTPGGTSTTCPTAFTTVATTCPWLYETSPIFTASGTYITQEGNEFNGYGDGVFTAENSNSNEWSTITQGVYIFGNFDTNYFSNIGAPDDSHAMYMQCFYCVAEGNLIQGPLGTAIGDDLKWRGVAGIFRYNYLGAGSAFAEDYVDIQDASNYETFEQYFNALGPFFRGDTAGGNVIAGIQEAAQNVFTYGNLVFPLAAGFGRTVYFTEDHQCGMCAQNGTLWYYSNTHIQDSTSFTNSTSSGFQTYYQQQFNAQNNLFWPAVASYSLNFQSTQIFNNQTNMFLAGSMCLGIFNKSANTCTVGPIVGGSQTAGTTRGWADGVDFLPAFPLSNPMNTHIYNLTSGNYLTTATQPMDSTTLAPIASSPLIGAGTVLTGLAASMQPRFEFVVNTGALAPRVFPLTVGAVETSTGPALTSIAVTPSSATVGTGLVTNFTATCTFANSTTANCTSGAVWGTSNTAVATIVGGQATGVTKGTVTVTATDGGITSNSVSLSVFTVPSSTVTGTRQIGVQQF
jgi:hypothetical protein